MVEKAKTDAGRAQEKVLRKQDMVTVNAQKHVHHAAEEDTNPARIADMDM